MEARGLGTAAGTLDRAALGAVVLLALVPVLCGLAYSLLASVGMTGGGSFTLLHYINLLRSGDLAGSAGFTLAVALAATALSFVVALALALALRGARGARRSARGLVALPLPVPHLVAGAMAVQILSASGLLARALHAVGGPGARGGIPGLVFDPWGLGIVLVYAWKEVPWLALVLLSVLEIAGEQHEAVAATLGAGRVRRLLRVVLPLGVRGALPAVLVIFAYVLGAFEVPLLVGRTWPPMLSVLAYQRFTGVDLDRRAEAFAISVLLSAGVAALIVAGRARASSEPA